MERLDEHGDQYTEVHVHILPPQEPRGRHHFIGECPCNPILEIEQDEDENEVLYLYHNVVH